MLHVKRLRKRHIEFLTSTRKKVEPFYDQINFKISSKRCSLVKKDETIQYYENRDYCDLLYYHYKINGARDHQGKTKRKEWMDARQRFL